MRGSAAPASSVRKLPGRELGDSAVDREGRRNVIVAQQQGERLAVDLGRKSGCCASALSSEPNRKARRPPGGRNRAASRPSGRGPASASARAVPQRQREHAGGALQSAANAPRLDRREQGLGVRMPAPVAGWPAAASSSRSAW